MSIQTEQLPSLGLETTRHTPLKVFVDASVRDGQAGVGIVIKNHNGKILARYKQRIGSGYGVKGAEESALDRAIHILADMEGVDHVKFYSDRMDVATNDYSLPEFEYGTVEHVGRENNKAAHLQAGGVLVGLP